MRPIELSLSGLHSFREKQTIQFERLRETGVFGIFGPTGSGKSSILDAMTLALYGKVERATNNTQGIMNHAEDTLTVSFTFEIGQGSSNRRYRVERAYKRNDELSVRTSVCRLVEIQDEEQVLADRERDVTSKIQEILGLTIDDFTRAVVLPQGKFAEFLSLRGSDRRKMLERLFHLEKYGERLNRRLREKLESANSALQQTEAAQSELGAATEKDVKVAKTEAIGATKSFEEKQKQLTDIEKTHDKQKQIWELQREKQQIEQRKTELANEREQMLLLQKSLDKALEADHLIPVFQEWKRWTKTADESQKQFHVINQERENINEKFARAKHNYEQAKAHREQKTPTLIQQIERYKHAQKIEVDCTDLQRKIETYEQAKHDVTKELAQLKKKHHQNNEQLEQAIENQTELEREKSDLSIHSEYRLTVQQALSDKRTIDSLLQTVKELRVDLDRVKDEYAIQRKNFQALKQSYRDRIQKNSSLYHALERTYHKTAELTSQIERHEKTLVRKKAKAEEQLEKQRVKIVAMELYEQLGDGEQCPVCGSTEHAQPAHKADSTISASTKQMQQNLILLEQQVSEMNVQKTELTYNLQKIEALSTRVLDKLKDPSPLQEQPASQNPIDPSLAAEDITNAILIEASSLKQDILQLEERAEQFITKMDELQQTLITEQSVLKVTAKNVEHIQEKHTKAKENYTNELQAWKEQYPNHSFDEIEQTQKIINEKDRKLATLSELANELTPVIEKYKQDSEQYKKKMNESAAKQEQLTFSISSLREDLTKKRDELREIVGEHTATERLSHCEKELETIQTNEQIASKQYDEADDNKKKLDDQAITIQERYVQAVERKEEATERWLEQLDISSFRDSEELNSAVVPQEKQTKWAEKIASFSEEWDAVKHDLARLVEQLDGKQISKEQWQEIQKKLTIAKEQYHEALNLKSKADYHYDQLMVKHERFKELEEERKKTQHLFTQLKKLETVFRGNAFVEFMAEEQLMQVTLDASARLGSITNERYAIEVNSDGGFVIRDDANGGVRRPISTLSGGETFLTSLALALSLSSHIQLRGKYPLEFFFLDEGFGTLDQELLDTVITSLEKLHMENVSIGIISHVPELKERLARKLIVQAAESAGRGSRVTMSP